MLKKIIATLACALVFVSPTASARLLVYPVLHDGDDPALMSDIVNAVNTVAEEFQEVRGITVTTTEMPFFYYAFATSDTPRSIAINHRYASDPGTLLKLINSDVKIHFHPALGHCTGPQLLAYHESAHIVDFGRGQVADTLLRKRFGDGRNLQGILSGYSFGSAGSINTGEALAEAFAAVKCDGGNWAEQELYHMLVD